MNFLNPLFLKESEMYYNNWDSSKNSKYTKISSRAADKHDNIKIYTFNCVGKLLRSWGCFSSTHSKNVIPALREKFEVQVQATTTKVLIITHIFKKGLQQPSSAADQTIAAPPPAAPQTISPQLPADQPPAAPPPAAPQTISPQLPADQPPAAPTIPDPQPAAPQPPADQPPSEAVAGPSNMVSVPQKEEPKLKADADKAVTILNILTISTESSEPQELVDKVNTLISDINQGATDLVNEGITFEMAQSFKEVKKQAKDLLKDPTLSPEITAALTQVIRQYDNIVESVTVLNDLRKLSQKIRQLNKQARNTDNFRLARESSSQLNDWFTLLRTITSQPITHIEHWKEHSAILRQKIWDGSLKATPLLEKKITWISGSKSSSVPSILRVAELAPTLSKSRPALVPTGLLLEHNIVPLAGELSWGIRDQGVGINNTHLSGMELFGLNTCIGYACEKNFNFNSQTEINFIKNFNEKLDILPRLRVAVLRLLLMNAPPDTLKEMKQHILNLKKPNSIPLSTAFPLWESHTRLVGNNCGLAGSPPSLESPPKKGQIVKIVRTGGIQKYAMIEKCSLDSWFKVICEKDGASKDVPLSAITLIDEAALDKEALAAPPLRPEEKHFFKTTLQTSEDKLDEILELFDTVKPLDLNEAEKSLIENPFPLIWASFTIKPTLLKNVGKAGKEGEQVVKGVAVLGEDIEVVFTPKDHVEQLQEALNDQGVTVLSFEAAQFLNIHQNLQG